MILIRNIARIKRVKNKLNIKGNKFKKYFIKLNKFNTIENYYLELNIDLYYFIYF